MKPQSEFSKYLTSFKEKKEEFEPLRRRPHVSEVQTDGLREFYENEMFKRAPVAVE